MNEYQLTLEECKKLYKGDSNINWNLILYTLQNFSLRNQDVQSLRYPVPENIRREVYLLALAYFTVKTDMSYSEFHSRSSGLCLVFPMLLWGHDHIHECAPDGREWDYSNTPIAFPELDLDELYLELKHYSPKELSGRNEIRKNYIIKCLNKLENGFVNSDDDTRGKNV